MRSGAGSEVGQAALLAGSVFLAVTPALDAYRVAGAAAVVGAAAAGSVVTGNLAVRCLRLSPLASYGASAAGLVALLLCADGPHPTAVARGVAAGPPRMLSETLPLSGNRASLSALVVLVWVCGAATAQISVRRPGRGRGSLALAVPVVLYVTCFAVASSAPKDGRLTAPALLLSLALAAVAIEARPLPSTVRAGTPRDYLSTLGVGAAAAVAGTLALIAPSVPGFSHRPAALHRRPPMEVPVITDPLDSMAQLRDGAPNSPAVPLLTMVVSAPWSGYLPLGYLDSYDGGQWRFSAEFQPTGGRVPSPAGQESPLSGTEVDQRIRLTGSLPVPLLPAIDRPSQVTGVAVVADPATGMLLPQSPKPDPAYSVTSTGSGETMFGISPVDAAGSSPSTVDTAIPPGTSDYLATTVRFVASLGATHPTASLAFLRAALLALQTGEKRVDPALAPVSAVGNTRTATTTTVAVSPSGGGTSLSEVINAVTVIRAATPEQFATFYAMLARYMGIPARVVTGFRLSVGDRVAPIPAGTYRVTNRQAWAWVEIPVRGYGWVICDPTPAATTAAGTAPPEAVSAPSTTIPPLRADAVPQLQDAGGHALAPPARVRSEHGAAVPLWAAALLGLGGAALAAAGAVPGQAALRRGIRRRRRRSADPAGLVVGAWLELLDGLEQAGMRPPEGATSSEVAEEVGHHFGADLVPAAAQLAALADGAVFSTRCPATAETAAEAWASSQQLRRRVLRQLDARQRIRSSFAVGSAPTRPHEADRQ